MYLYRESAIRKQADKPTLAMLDLWQSISTQIVGAPIEVFVGNRKENPKFRLFAGQLYTAYPQTVGGEVKLVLWLDSTSKVNAEIVTHEIGHWVLRLKGFCALIYKPDKNCNTELLLNSMADHVPLYKLQRSFGHEPQSEVDSRTLNNIKLFSKKRKLSVMGSWLNDALMLADDFVNCSKQCQTSLENVLSKNCPDTLESVKTVIKLAESYDLQIAEQNLVFRQEVVKDLQLGVGWMKADDVGRLASMVKKAQGREKNGNTAR